MKLFEELSCYDSKSSENSQRVFSQISHHLKIMDKRFLTRTPTSRPKLLGVRIDAVGRGIHSREGCVFVVPSVEAHQGPRPRGAKTGNSRKEVHRAKQVRYNSRSDPDHHPADKFTTRDPGFLANTTERDPNPLFSVHRRRHTERSSTGMAQRVSMGAPFRVYPMVEIIIHVLPECKETNETK